MNPIRCYVATRNGIFMSEDQGVTWTPVTSDINTSQIVDMAVNHRYVEQSIVISGDGIATTPYVSSNNVENFTNGANCQGKEINFINESAFVIAGKNRAASTGSEVSMTFDGGQSIGISFDVTPVFAYPGALFNDVTVMSVDFPNTTGGYIAIAGDNNNSADQIITRTYDQGNTFPDAIILPYSTYGIIRAVWASPEDNIVFASGEPGQPTGKLYSVDPSLTQLPVELMTNVTVGDPADNRISRFAPVPPVFPTPQNTTYRLDERESVYFLDSAGNVYFSANKGFTWELRGNATRTGDCVDIIALNLNTVLVLGNSPAAVYQSIDGGVTFTEIPQPSWTDPRAIVLSSVDVCETCPNFYEQYLNASGAYQRRCIRNPRNGTICKPPYVYNQVLEACATPSTIEPSNIIVSIDRSGSVDPTETDLLERYVITLLEKLQDRLFDGSIEVGILQWSSLASFSTPFTNDLDVLRQGVVTLDQEGTCGSSSCSGGLTDHKRALCLAFEKMYEQSVLKPTAKNVILHFTDGGYNPDTPYDCDLTSIGLNTVVPATASYGGFNCNAPSMYTLIQEAKTSLNNGAGVEIYLIALGTPGDISGVESWAFNPITAGCVSPQLDIVPSRNPITNNPYYYNAGTFDDAEFIADQIRIGLSSQIIPTTPCPEECPGVPGIDNLGYCQCNEEFLIDNCAAIIKNCETGEEIRVISPGNFYYNKIVTLRDYSATNFFYAPGCWEILPTSVFNEPEDKNIGIDQEYIDCPTCASPPWYRLTDCLDDTFIIYTQDSYFQSLIDSNSIVITHTNYPDRCFLIENIGPTGDFVESNITPTGIDFTGGGCQDCPREVAINFRLVNCDDGTTIYCSGLTNDLQQYIGQTVNIQGYGNACWQVEIESSPQPIQQDVIVTASYAGCPECQPPVIYQFVNCDEETIILYSSQDFSQYVGQVVNLQEYPGNCWSVSVAQGSFPTQNLTISGEPFIDCPACRITYYQLTNCANPEVFLISTSTELSRYLGRTITAAGYPGLCFTVTPPQCDCIRATINGVEYDAYPEPAQFNGRNVYYITTDSGDELAIAWSINPNRWELFDRNTNDVYGFNVTDTDCPFSNFWTIIQASPYIITTVSFCADRIYNIAPELDFADCVPCINCI